MEYFWVFGESDSKISKLIYSLADIFALILELTLLLKGTVTLENICLGVWELSPGSANVKLCSDLVIVPSVIAAKDEVTVSSTDCCAVGLDACSGWRGNVLSANASDTACFTALEIEAERAGMLTTMRGSCGGASASPDLVASAGGVAVTSDTHARLELRVVRVGMERFLGGMTYDNIEVDKNSMKVS